MPYGSYSINITLPEGDDYELLDNSETVLVVDSENINLELTVHRATMYVEEGD